LAILHASITVARPVKKIVGGWELGVATSELRPERSTGWGVRSSEPQTLEERRQRYGPKAKWPEL